MTSIVLKKDVTMLDIQSTRMLGQVGFLAKVWKCILLLGRGWHAYVCCIFVVDLPCLTVCMLALLSGIHYV
jgi:hypothetical protein